MAKRKTAHGGRRARTATAGGRVVRVRAGDELTRVNGHAAGIDIGSDRH